MNKTKMILAVIGGAIGFVVLTLGFLTWRSTMAKTTALEGDDYEGTEGLESVVSTAESLSRSPIYPCAESETAIESNRTALADWSEEVRRHMSRGDRFFTPVTPAAFKSFIGSDAKRLKMLPGAVQGRLAKPEFAFGPFKDYIDEGKMPADSELADLQRKWDDVATVTELLATNGVAELLDVQFKGAKPAAAAKAQDRSGNKKKARKPAAAAKKDDAPAVLPAPCTYVFTFAAKPASLIRVVNALEVGERFTVVESLAFERAKDIAEVLSADEKDEAKKATSGRGRRRGRNRIEEEKEESEDDKAKNGLVTDPQMDDPLTVTVTVAVYDFRTLEEEKGASK